MKHFPKILPSLIITALAGVLIAHAAETSYVPLAPLPLGAGGSTPSSYTMSTYLSGTLKLLIALGGATAILMAIVGGTQYVASGIAPAAKNDAKDRITNAFIGLALVLTSYLILNSINPALVGGGFRLPGIGVAPVAEVVAVTVAPTHTWFDDNGVRQQLAGIGISVNRANCLDIGQGKSVASGGIGGSSCTSVYQLGNRAILALAFLKSSCTGCNVTITGGTEYWLHSATTQHKPGNSVVDLSPNGALDAKIVTGTSLGTQAQCSSLGSAYQLSGNGGGIYVDEPNYDSNGNTVGRHWHVCY